MIRRNDPQPLSYFLLLIGSSFAFTYCLGVGVHELGHVLAYKFYGIPTIEFVLDPFGHSYMTPKMDYAPGEILQRSGGSLFNIICACLASSFFWRKKSLYAFPILMWPATAFIQESVAIILDLLNGMTFDWAFVVSEGVSIYFVLFLSLVFLITGGSIFLSLLAIAGVRPSFSISKIMTISVLGVSPFFIISLLYAIFFLVSERGNWILSKSISLGASVALSLVFAVLFKPAFSTIERLVSPKSQNIKKIHIGISILITLSYILFCLFFFNKN